MLALGCDQAGYGLMQEVKKAPGGAWTGIYRLRYLFRGCGRLSGVCKESSKMRFRKGDAIVVF